MHIKTSCLATLLLLFFIFPSVAQTHELIGSIAMKDGKSMTYTLVFTDSAGIVKGYSISDPGPKQTKAVIRGKIDRDKRTFSFNETRVVNAKNKTVEYCLLRCYCKIKEQKGVQIFKGKVTGYINGDPKKPCGRGTVAFSTAADILKLTQKLVEKLDTNKLNDEQKQAIDSFKKIAQNTSIDLVDSKKGAAFKWQSDSLRIEVYDDGEIDYDRVSIIINDKKILDNHTSTKQPYSFSIPIPPGKHVIKFHAENEGNTPPNTTKFILWDEGIKHMISTNLYYGQDATVEIHK